MSKKRLIEAIKVNGSCSEKWEEMTGNNYVRFCSHCDKNVNDLSAMTRREALRVVRRAGGDLCVRYISDPRTGTPLFANNLYRITRRAPAIATGIITASISLSAMVQAQESSIRPPVSVEKASTSDPGDITRPVDEKVPFSGTVTDGSGRVVAGATATLRNKVTGKEWTYSADVEGVYRFDEMDAGDYILFCIASGFETYVKEVRIDGQNTVQNVSLKPGNIEEVITYSQSQAIARIPNLEDPLSKAVQDDDEALVKKLVNKKNVHFVENDYEGATPLFIAVENGNAKIAGILLKAGANVNARNIHGQTPLMMFDGDATADLVKLLLKHGARVDLEDRSQNTALILAAEEDAGISVINALIDAGADVNHQNKHGFTALIKAAVNNDIVTVILLIEAKADLGKKTAEGLTAWDLAGADMRKLIEDHGGRSGLTEK